MLWPIPNPAAARSIPAKCWTPRSNTRTGKLFSRSSSQTKKITCASAQLDAKRARCKAQRDDRRRAAAAPAAHRSKISRERPSAKGPGRHLAVRYRLRAAPSPFGFAPLCAAASTRAALARCNARSRAQGPGRAADAGLRGFRRSRNEGCAAVALPPVRCWGRRSMSASSSRNRFRRAGGPLAALDGRIRLAGTGAKLPGNSCA